MSGEESLLLVEHFRCPGESVAGETCLSFTDVLSHLKVGVDTCFLDNLHLFKVKDKKVVACLVISILVD